MPETLIMPGEVWLVGAGPGDQDLLTRKAEKLIRAATVLFHDALVSPQILDLAEPRTRLVPVGKRSGRHSKSQSEINALLIEAASNGERVVRLKGGDPSIFGRSGEETDALRSHGIAVRICPGITAASAASASAGLSLTLRGLARKLVFVTAHAQAGDPPGLDWAALADPQATLAVYMGKAACRSISEQLIAAGLSAATPAIIVENASLPNERIVRTTLALLEIAAGPAITGGPAVLLIGNAVGENVGLTSSNLGRAQCPQFADFAH
jgi:uroporphyrin-III C-methyltransferase